MSKNVAKISAAVAAKIPYIRMDAQKGVFEIKKGVFSKTYKLKLNDGNNSKTNMTLVQKRFEVLLNAFSTDVKFQFTIHNRNIEHEHFLKNILLLPTSENQTKNDLINRYNYLIADNARIGHNNVNKDNYFTIIIAADIIDEAIDKFEELDLQIKSLFFGTCEIEAIPLSTVERLESLYYIYHDNSDEPFGSKVDFDNSGVFSFDKMKYMKVNTKDVIGPSSIKENKDHFIINNNVYGRSFFINTLPTLISSNLITDLTNISSNMLFSIHYETIDAQEGFDTVANLVGKNTVVTESYDRSTVEARKQKKTIKTISTLTDTEDTYFHQTALELFTDAVAKQQKVLVCTFAITLFSDNLDDLNRDSSALKLSASKFVTQIKTLDLQQIAGFNTSLPLGNVLISAKRTFPLGKISRLVPIDIQSTQKKDGVFIGLNAMNDNLVIMNRKNNLNTNGLIAGVKYSGKTFQCKREIANAYMSTDDKIIVISTRKGDYEDFFARIEGCKRSIPSDLDIFYTDEDYGLVEDKKIFKSMYLRALLAEYREESGKFDSEMQRLNDLQVWNDEEDLLESYLWRCNCYTSLANVKKEMENCPRISDNLNKLEEDLSKLDVDANHNSRLNLYQVDNKKQLIMLLDSVWNTILEDKRKNIATWVFIDSIDELLLLEESSDYLQEFVIKCAQSKSILTMVVQESVRLFNECRAIYELFLEQIGYIKLLNQGPKERRYYAECLSLPSGLINYIANAEPSEGIIITPISNIAFDDSFVENPEQNEFYELFIGKKEKLDFFMHKSTDNISYNNL